MPKSNPMNPYVHSEIFYAPQDGNASRLPAIAADPSLSKSDQRAAIERAVLCIMACSSLSDDQLREATSDENRGAHTLPENFVKTLATVCQRLALGQNSYNQDQILATQLNKFLGDLGHRLDNLPLDANTDTHEVQSVTRRRLTA